jgi:hypothetical protein
MAKVKKVGVAVATVFLQPEFRPFEIRLARALFIAVVTALGVKYGVQA